MSRNFVSTLVDLNQYYNVNITRELEFLGIDHTQELNRLIIEEQDQRPEEESIEMSFTPSIWISNQNNYRGEDVHIGFCANSRLVEARRYYSRNDLPSSSMRLFCGTERTMMRYTEDPSVVTCPDCLAHARSFGYCGLISNEEGEFSSGTSRSSSNSIVLHNDSVTKVVNWVPKDCAIIISNGKIIVRDEKIKNDVEVNSLHKACKVIIESFFEPFQSETILANTSIFSKTISTHGNKRFNVQGFKYDAATQKIDGLILKAEKGNKDLMEATFEDIFYMGYHFEDGSPCGSYVKDRTPIVIEQETEENESAIDLDMSMIGMDVT